jgi:hypothetical protein
MTETSVLAVNLTLVYALYEFALIRLILLA